MLFCNIVNLVKKGYVSIKPLFFYTLTIALEAKTDQ